MTKYQPISTPTITCGQRGSCRREAALVVKEVADKGMYADIDNWAFDHARFCRMHASAADRRRWNRPGEMIPIEQAPLYVAEAQRRKAEREAEDARTREAAIAASKARNEKIAERDWASLDNPYEVRLVEEDKGFIAPRIEQVVYVGEIDGPDWDRWHIEFSQTAPGPRYVRLNQTGSLSPLGARALAEGLIKAAEIAEATNARLRAEREEKTQ